jgi:predicted nuclease of predicted toxin-antitoxin system
MAKVHGFLEMWQDSKILRSTQKAAHAQNPQMTAMGYISDSEETVKSWWSAFQFDGAAAFQLTENSLLPLTLLQIDLSGGKTKVINFHRIQSINQHPPESDDDSAAECNSDTEDWHNRTGDLDDPNDYEIEGQADIKDEMYVSDDSDVNDGLEVKAAPNIPGLIRPVRKSTHLPQEPITESLPTINIETRKGKGYRRR